MTTITSDDGLSSMVVTGQPKHSTLAAALAAFQAELPKLLKDERAKVKGETKDGRAYDRSYGYADLAQVVETVLPVLGKHGLSVTSKSTFDQQGNFILEVALLHESGEREIGYWPLPDPRRSGPQDIGSAMTYGRRYLTLALSGAYPGGEDDDGAKAQASTRERWEDAQPRRNEGAQAAREAAEPVRDEAGAPRPPQEKTEWTDAEIAEYHAKISRSDVTLAVKGYDWMASRSLHERKIDYPGGDALTATQALAFRLADLAVQPDANLADIAIIRANAEDRGLLGTAVSDSTTLGEELAMARDTLSAAAEKLIDDTAPEVAAAGRD